MKLHYIITLAAAFTCPLTSCNQKTVNSLQDAVDESHDGRGNKLSLGLIVEKYIQGDWAYVRTSGDVIGAGQFVVVPTETGRKWTALEFALFRVEGKSLTLIQFQRYANRDGTKGKQIDKQLGDEAIKRWANYLSSAGLVVN